MTDRTTHPPADRKGNVTLLVLASMGAILGVSAVVMDLGYAWVVRQQLQNTVDASATAAAMELDGTASGITKAKTVARQIAALNPVNGHAITLADDDFSWGEWDANTETFTTQTDPLKVNALRLTGKEDKVGLGMSKIVWGRDGVDLQARAAALAGPGNANDGTGDNVGLIGGHFDVDTNATYYAFNKGKTDGHVHEYDNEYNVTSYKLMSPHGSKLQSLQSKVSSTQRFKILLANPSLSRGGVLFINGEAWSVVDYAKIPVSSLPVYSLGGVSGSTKLTSLEIYFDRDTIRSCKLHPTNTSHVRSNVPGPNNEWRNGAFVIQLGSVNSAGVDAFTRNTSWTNGGVHGVITSGLLFENTIFWHWSGPSYHQSGWQAQFDALPCVGTKIVE